MVLFTPQPKRVHLPQCQCSFPVHTYLRILLSLFFLLQHFFHVADARYPCLNDGEPVLLGQSGNEFRCECLAGFFGPFCEYQDTSQTVEGKERGSSSPTTSQIRGGWEATFVNLLLCVFFLLLLPSLIIYAVRAFYLFMKRCHSHYGHQHEQPRPMPSLQPRQNNHPTPPPQYWAAMAEEGSNGTTTIRASQIWRATGGGAHGRLWPIGQRRRQGEERGRSESPVTEVTVQLPASICRPLHGTRSVGPLAPLHQTHSLTLNEFHELLLNIQREMLTQQQTERQQHVPTTPSISSLNVPNMPPPPPPPPPPLLLEPPPNYELALNSTCPLQESSQRRPF